MGRQDRLHYMQRIEQLRGSQLICYITGDRENLNTRIASDVNRVFYRHLEKGKKGFPVDVFLYTRGGDILTPWRLVHLIREYTNNFSVLVPFRAYSAGTLICLGADHIIMGKMGELGPIDPSVINAFNPPDHTNPPARVPVNVEDVYSFLSLINQKAGVVREEEVSKVFRLLVEKIHPLALGNVHRNWLLIRSLAYRLLGLRQENMPRDKINNIVDYLTEKLYAHNHMIPRQEACGDIGLPVIFAGEELENLMWKLYEDYVKELRLAESFAPAEYLDGKQGEFEVPSGVVESIPARDNFIFKGTVYRQDFPDGEKVNVNIREQGWKIIS